MTPQDLRDVLDEELYELRERGDKELDTLLGQLKEWRAEIQTKIDQIKHEQQERLLEDLGNLEMERLGDEAVEAWEKAVKG